MSLTSLSCLGVRGLTWAHLAGPHQRWCWPSELHPSSANQLDSSSTSMTNGRETHSGFGLWVEKLRRRHFERCEFTGRLEISWAACWWQYRGFDELPSAWQRPALRCGGLGTFFCLVGQRRCGGGRVADTYCLLGLLASQSVHSGRPQWTSTTSYKCLDDK